ncbi:hypothetical protein HPP92_013538 [Vanilla planifolia]|uniref:SWIM-type domain-containing protein n=1 Tax=Vanilla planifolia TaxID=51239 RepID=A0A835QZL3_VANPL|nr:hypothetical protein HPP92_013538 [Vanilla planifolia]
MMSTINPRTYCRTFRSNMELQYHTSKPGEQKERGLAAIYGSSEEGYFLLPYYCEQIKKHNPGSIAQVFTTGSEHRFQRLFISFNASIHGFLYGCMPLIGLGGMELKSKYLGTLLSAVSFDADGGLFPVAFGIVDVETEESWLWFLSEFHKLLDMSTQTIPKLTILSNGNREIDDAVKRKFPTANHCICVRYLAESINKEFKNSRLVNLLWKAAYSTTTTSFKERMAEIEEVCADAAKWIHHVPPCRWSVVHFEGSRFGHLSSNIDEFHKWILDAHELPIIQVIKRIHVKLMQEFDQRRERGKTWTCVLAPSAEIRLLEAKQAGCCYQVLRSDEIEFEVLSADRSHIVNIGTHSCSCRDWQLYGIPCSHAVAALLSCKKDVYEYTDRHFTVASYRETYSQAIKPIPERNKWANETECRIGDEAGIVRPPKFRRPPGRPEKKRLCMEESTREKHTVRCSRCNQTGHYKRTCKATDIIQHLEY